MLEQTPNGTQSLPPSSPLYEGFSAVEALQEAGESAGWDLEYRQIGAGRLEAHTILQQVGKLSLLQESASRRLEIRGSAPEALITVLIPQPNVDFCINGRRLQRDRIILLEAGVELHSISHANAEALSIHIPESLYYAQVRKLERDDRPFVVRGTMPVDVGHGTVNRLKQMAMSAMQPSHAQWQAQGADTHLAGELISLIRRSNGFSVSRNGGHQISRRHKLNRALDYIEAHFRSAIPIADICEYAGVSQSTLERLFDSFLQETPTAYIRARRLHAVRKALADRDPAKTIASIAQDNGFTHMGRFSAVYQQQFGVLPRHERL